MKIPTNKLNLIENENKLKNEKTELLQDLCEILKPKSVKNEAGYVVKTKNFNYPLDINKLSQGEITNFLLLKGDILFLTPLVVYRSFFNK